jgi:tetratricopeptide (TPR) repeat protein
MGLGRAYLNLGQTDKSLAAFEAAVKINRSPQVLNDVAYYLSDNEVHLDKAVQYAETAVTTVANNLRNVETANLKIEDLYNVTSLAAYWDTLGWIYYQQDEMDKAEAYLRASWMLHQHGAVAYNLGVLTEERGKKQEAIRLFAQGAAGLESDSYSAERLRKLVPKAAIPSLLRTAKQDLRSYNIFDVGQLVPNLRSPIEAEFFLVYAPDATRNAQAIDVKFIKGDERLRPLAAQLKTIKYRLVFPDNSPTKIIRRGALLCLPRPGVCTFTMISPELVRSVD